jgi:hypothetical protein
MELTLPLLGTLNRQLQKNSPLRPKHIVKVTAERLAQLLVYERRGKRRNDPFKILPTSTIRIDKEIQRGTDTQGFQLQQPSKVLDIAMTLLGNTKSPVPRAYLGSLIWNVRDDAPFLLSKREVEGRPPEWELTITTDAIYLTDSAHRHLGIVEAYKAYMAAKDKYPIFQPGFEFAVELYNLAKAEEKELFNELNSKQKKISAAKQKALDVSSPIGALKDAILELDIRSRKLLENNIEVSSNTNDKHTLMTMSVFVASISEVFSTDQIRDARQDEDTRDEYALFYTSFLYKLQDTLVVRHPSEAAGGEVDTQPFSNLWLEHIKPIEDSYGDDGTPATFEQRLDQARQQATKINQELRRVDLANHNGTIKALFRLAGVVRKMPNWGQVLERLQTDLNLPMRGKFFQRSNADLFKKESESDIPIASLNNDESINLQVQAKNIAKLHRYLRNRLQLDLPPVLQLRRGQGEWHVLRSGPDSSGHWTLSTNIRNVRVVQFLFHAVRGDTMHEETLGLSVIPGFEWKQGTLKGQKRLAANLVREDDSYEHPCYTDIIRYIATFEIDLPESPKNMQGASEVAFEFRYPDIDGTTLQFKTTIPCSIEGS